MIRSMTGFGEAEATLEEGLLRAEIKTVNHRFFNLSLRTPAGFDRLESEIQKWLKPYVSRGHVHVVLTLRRSDVEEEDLLPELDLVKARNYVTLLRSLKGELALSGEVGVDQVARYDDIFRTPEPDRERQEIDPDAVRSVVQDAAAAVVEMREIEGSRLRDDLEESLEVLDREIDEVEARAPARLLRERDRLRDAVRELTEQEDVDEERLAREIAYLAEKWDINEEIVRFRSHLALFAENLASSAEEGVGKRLSFVVQEMHREANTIGSKANDADIARAAVSMKEQIERLREQVENVE